MAGLRLWLEKKADPPSFHRPFVYACRSNTVEACPSSESHPSVARVSCSQNSNSACHTFTVAFLTVNFEDRHHSTLFPLRSFFLLVNRLAMSTQSLVLDNTMGAAFIGVVVAAALLGVSLVQTWYYFTHQKDNWPLKSLVAAVMCFDTVHQMLISHTVYIYVITNFNNPAQLENLVWSILVEVLFNGFTALLVQSFLTMRVWRLSNKNIWLTSVVVALVAGEFGCVIAFGAMSLGFRTFAELQTLKYLSITVNALAAAGDVLIAGILCTLLHRSRTGFHRSDTMINKLILFAVNTGFLTSLFAVASLISIVVAGETFLYIAFFFCMGRLYSNSLLATLNARKMIRGAADGIQSTSDNLSLSLRDFPKNGTMSSRRPTNISIKIDTTKEFVTDSDQGHDAGKAESALVSINDRLKTGR
ncbi:hypothetical protein BDZ94DRAFT_1253580 [Collybia nuda]|uniref:DUF6534 domain-containing protein n=1 Tax=Collybia nuda TaxID=64659 RepID=A0A9P6CME4_9AGAR|nr:hypothetical protein BDZ94DRAFT_1253580 [Collybia nuda]